jgi:hypothetical protein
MKGDRRLPADRPRRAAALGPDITVIEAKGAAHQVQIGDFLRPEENQGEEVER